MLSAPISVIRLFCQEHFYDWSTECLLNTLYIMTVYWTHCISYSDQVKRCYYVYLSPASESSKSHCYHYHLHFGQVFFLGNWQHWQLSHGHSNKGQQLLVPETIIRDPDINNNYSNYHRPQICKLQLSETSKNNGYNYQGSQQQQNNGYTIFLRDPQFCF